MEQKSNYFKGILGGLAFGLIASIPWVLVYTLLNYLIVYLGTLIGLGVVLGYKTFVGKLDKKMTLICALITFFIVTLNALVIIPGLILVKSGYYFTVSNLIIFYQIDGVMSSIMYDYIISILFAALGAGVLIFKLNIQVRNNETDIKLFENTGKILHGYMGKIKEYFVNQSATDNEHAITIPEDISFDKSAFRYLKASGALVETDGKYFYDLEKGSEAENKYLESIEKGTKSNKRYIIFLIIVIVLSFLVSFLSSLNS